MAKKQGQAQKYEVVRRIRHDGDDYAPGETVEMPPEQAEALLEIGAIRTFPAQAKTEEPAQQAPAADKQPAEPEQQQPAGGQA